MRNMEISSGWSSAAGGFDLDESNLCARAVPADGSPVVEIVQSRKIIQIEMIACGDHRNSSTVSTASTFRLLQTRATVAGRRLRQVHKRRLRIPTVTSLPL